VLTLAFLADTLRNAVYRLNLPLILISELLEDDFDI
jgi:hypothetical protein